MRTLHKKLLETPVGIDWQVTEAVLTVQDPEAIETEVDRRMTVFESQRKLGREVVRSNVEIVFNERVRVLKNASESTLFRWQERWESTPGAWGYFFLGER